MKSIQFLLFSALLLIVSCQNKEEPLAENPFQHGVASGDPLADAVILWTRVTGDSLGEATVKWKIATDIHFKKVVQKGESTTSADRDYTVKVDAKDLAANTYFYYQFDFGGYSSPIGRTKTTANEDVNRVKLAVVSCSNYEAGYYNAYARLAQKEGIDAVLHLGDYIYEYQPGGYGDTTLDRKHLPAKEIITLEDYRIRYAQYRSDMDLQQVHQVHPFINIWDDHEIANNANIENAQNHDESEGDYQARAAAAKQAFHEWLPVRESEKHYRKFEFGQLVTLLMLDERLEGRSIQVKDKNDENFASEERSMLGETQFNWLVQNLNESTAQWKVLGNQVMFSDWVISPISGKERPLNMDAWDGYPAEKKRLIKAFQDNDIKDVVFVTGDSHASWAFEVTSNAANYDPRTSNGTVAVEFGTPSITSANLGTYRPADVVKEAEMNMRKVNRHLKYVDMSKNGYFILDMDLGEVRADFYYVDKVNAPSTMEEKGVTFIKRRGSNQLVRGN